MSFHYESGQVAEVGGVIYTVRLRALFLFSFSLPLNPPIETPAIATTVMPAPYDTDTTADELVHDYSHLIKDKVVLMTGVSSGSLGGFFVQSIAKAKPGWLILAARNADKLQQIANDIMTAYPDIKVRKVEIDLGSLKSVRDAAAQVNSWDDIPVIDVMVNNAGVMAVDYQLSPEGFESHLATNHLGPFLFTNLIIKKILASKSPRIVVVSSDGHRLNPFRFDDYNFDVSDTWDFAWDL
jgi:Short-chain alcohol dehydrogenase of unknown specificity